MWSDLLEQAVRLRGEGEACVLVTVVACRSPQSAKPGAKAIVRRNGIVTGWVGGGCVQPIVVKEALNALTDGQPRLVSVTPEQGGGEWEALQEHVMTCLGGGALLLYLEPVMPRPELLIFGETPVAQTLARLGKLMDFSVCVVHPRATREAFPDADLLLNELQAGRERIGPRSYVVVATQGNGDEEALEAATGGDPAYLGLVASEKKGSALFRSLQARGVTPELLQRVKCPAGLQLGVLPAEIAFSIMAEIIQVKRQPRVAPVEEVMAVAATEAIDPICGMTVEVATATHTAAYGDQLFYFCCAGCRETFDRTPERYVGAGGVKAR